MNVAGFVVFVGEREKAVLLLVEPVEELRLLDS